MQYTIRNTKCKGGDYGRTLTHGVLVFIDYNNNPHDVVYQRTIPFIPDIALINDSAIVASEAFKNKYDKVKLSGIDFIRIQKVILYELDWQIWDETNWKYPSDIAAGTNDDPEDYFSVLKHIANRECKFYLMTASNVTGDMTIDRVGDVLCTDHAKSVLGNLVGCEYKLA
jgi:hypothetical protein